MCKAEVLVPIQWKAERLAWRQLARGRAGIRIRVCLAAKCLPSTPSQLTYKVASTAGAPSARIQWSSCGHWDVSLPSPQGAWHGEGGPVWEGGRRGTLCLGMGEGGDLIFKEQSFWAGSDLRGGTGARVMEKVWTPDLDLGRKCL